MATTQTTTVQQASGSSDRWYSVPAEEVTKRLEGKLLARRQDAAA